MRFSRSLPASAHCLPSPNGRLVATVLGSVINIRAVDSLRTVKDISLPRDFVTAAAASLQWSSSSRLLLVASVDVIHVFSALQDDFHATIRNPTPPAAKPIYIGFGTADTNVCVCASLGLKFAIFDLSSSRSVEIANPKFHTAASARKGFCVRPQSGHLAILTRTSGKDMISIHHPVTIELQRSWFPGTLDAQGLVWSPDGKWLVTWESAAHGHKVLFFTPDGDPFKVWSGPQPLAAADADTRLGPGVRLLEFSADSQRVAIGDSSRHICILNVPSATESLRLLHPSNIVPRDTLQVWQEQAGNSGHRFVRSSQTLYPPNRLTGSNSPLQSGCVFMAFDRSSALLATKLEDAPSTVWIWDTSACELRAVLLFHGNLSRISWHPIIRETLLVTCDGHDSSSLAFMWDPLSEGPKIIDVPAELSNSQIQAQWLELDDVETAAIFVTNGADYVLVSAVQSEDEPVPWLNDSDLSGLRSPHLDASHYYPNDMSEEEASELDDTFCFKTQ